MTTTCGADARLTNQVRAALRWLCQSLLVAAVFAGPAQAATYTGVWDPTYGTPFTNLGWRGTADYFVPDSCVPTGTADLNNATACGGGAIITAAQVQFYDITDTGQSTISSLFFNPATMPVTTLRFVSGELTQLTTSTSDLIHPTGLSAFSVSATTEFGLYFSLDGPVLGWRDCGYSPNEPAYRNCKSGLNDSGQFPPHFVVTRVPEPGTLALVCLALLALVPRRLCLIGR